MTGRNTTCTSADRQRRRSALAGAAAALAAFMLAWGAHAAPAKEPPALSAEDRACLDCHARPDLQKTLAGGGRLPLQVSGEAFARSVHGKEGCEACHSGLRDDHDKRPAAIASRRALAASLMEQCRDCHGKTMKQYEDSVHAAVVRAGGDKAPLCTDCHNPHTAAAGQQAGGAAQAAPCGKCHEPVAQAFARSVHAQGGEEALVCKDCHRTHNVKAAALANHLRGECLSCHKDTAASHAQWLPNTQRHLDAVACAACHTPGAARRVNLTLYEGGAPVQEGKVGVPTFVQLSSAAGPSAPGLEGRALWSLLREFNQDGAGGKMMLRGRLEVQNGAQAHQLAAKALALKDCDTCHRRGAASFQSVTVSMAGPDGRPLRQEAGRGLLTSIESVGAVGGFYAIGSTRIVLLDILLLLAVAGGVALPGAHLLAKLYFRRRRARPAADGSSASK